MTLRIPPTGGATALPSTGVTYATEHGVAYVPTAGDQSADFETALLAARRAAVASGARYAHLELPEGVISIGTGRTQGFACGPTADGPGVIITGQGAEATTLTWGGAGLPYGQYAFDYSGMSTPTELMRGLAIYGPGNNALTLGRPPGKSGGGYVEMNGVKMSQGGRLTDVFMRGFVFGAHMLDSHCKLTDCTIGSCYASVLIDSTGALANNGFERCTLTGNTFASVAITKANSIGADHWRDMHIGYSPMGIYRMNTQDGAGQQFIAATQMDEVAIESCGHAAIYCEDKTGTIGPKNSLFITAFNVPDTNFRVTPLSNTGCALTAESKVVTIASTNGLVVGMPVANANLPAGTVIRAIGSATQFTVSNNATGTAAGQTLTTSYSTDAAIRAATFTGNDLPCPDLLEHCAGELYVLDVGGFSDNHVARSDLKTLRSDGKKLLSPTTTISPSGGAHNWFRGGSGGEATIEVAGEAITSGQLLMHGGTLGGSWAVQPYQPGSGKFCIGQATSDAAAGAFIGVMKVGTSVTGLPDAAFSNAGFGTPLKPSTTDAGKFTNGTVGTDQIVGYTRNGNKFTLVGRI